MSEIVEARGWDSKTHDIGGGQRRTDFRRGAHYQDDLGDFQDSDTTLEAEGGEVLDTESGAYFTHRCGKVQTPMGVNRYKQPLKVLSGPDMVLIQPKGANDVIGIKDVDRIVYPEAYTNTDISRRVTTTCYDERITLKAAGHPTRFEFDIPTGLDTISGGNGSPGIIQDGTATGRQCTITWTATGYYFDLPDLSGLSYPIEVT